MDLKRFLKTIERPFKAFLGWAGASKQGFSLIETAMMVAIMGILMGTFLPFLQSTSRVAKIKKTKQNQKKIAKALGRFYQEHGFLPCPASVTAQGEERGIFKRVCKDYPVGIVPYRTLGLSPNDAKDGFHRWMTYGMDPVSQMNYNFSSQNPESALKWLALCENFFFSKPCLNVKEKGHLVIDNALEIYKIKATGEKAYDGVAFVLVSHGPKGYGSFQEDGSLLSPPSSSSVGPCKSTNFPKKSPVPWRFCACPESQGDQGFDDIVFWVSRKNFITFYTGQAKQCLTSFIPVHLQQDV